MTTKLSHICHVGKVVGKWTWWLVFEWNFPLFWGSLQVRHIQSPQEFPKIVLQRHLTIVKQWVRASHEELCQIECFLLFWLELRFPNDYYNCSWSHQRRNKGRWLSFFIVIIWCILPPMIAMLMPIDLGPVVWKVIYANPEFKFIELFISLFYKSVFMANISRSLTFH